VDVGDAVAGLAVDGLSLLPLAANPAEGVGRNLLVEAGPTLFGDEMFYSGVRTDRWLYVEYDTGETELYDMTQDPYQLQSLHADPAHAGVRTELSAVVATLRDCSGPSCRGATPPSYPDVFISALAEPPSAVAPGGGFSVTDTTANIGGAAAGSSTTRYYLSPDQARDTGDRLLTGGRVVPGMAAGASHTGSRSVTVPSNVAPGRYYLLACADDQLVVSESTETNNCRSSASAVNVATPSSGADLVVSVVADPPSSVVRGATFSVTDTTANIGYAAAGSSTTRYYLSADQVRNTGDRLLTGGRSVPSLAAGTSRTGSRSVTVPRNVAPGNYYLLACADDRLVVPESIETNNCRNSSLRVSVTTT